ncbi:MAG TPA: sodium:solute symporter family protein [Verrucomicrobiae bacterium]|jgi:SSS family solute:Na+ symporter|nr:sodium:solute symporter family protein [Verrucomicrobiae bacterium]
MDTRTAIDIGLLLYGGLMLAVSTYWMFKVKKPADYLVGGRSLPFWVLTGNITAGCIGTGVIIGGSGLAYLHGWAGAAWPVALGIGTAVAGLLFAVMRRYQFMTIVEEVASYYEGKRVVIEFTNITLWASQFGWLTAQIIGGSKVLAAATGMSNEASVIITGIIIAGIAIPGGFKSVVYTDFVQAFILVSGFVCVTIMALHHNGGLAGLRQNVPASYFSIFGVDSYPHYGTWAVGGMILTLVLSVIADPGRRMSMFGAASERGARWSMVCAGLIVMAFSVLIGITGMYAHQLNPNIAAGDADKALLWLVIHVLPAWLAAFVVIAAASGIFSCANGNAMAISTFYVRHIYPLVTGGKYPRRPLFAARILLVCAFILCTSVAIKSGSIVGTVTSFLPITMSGLAIIILMGRFWKRATWQGAMAALIITPILTLVAREFFANAFWNNSVILAIPGFVVHFIVSLLTPKPTRTFEQVANALTHERQNIEEKALGLSPEKTLNPNISSEKYEAS